MSGDGRWTLEAGALALADLGLAAIDEFDKMNENDRSSMHEAMEQQRISISKAGINATLSTRCAILAAANPKSGRFQSVSEVPFTNQINLKPPLLSRFDIIWMMRDEVKVEDDERIARYILDTKTQGVSETEIEEAISIDPSEEIKDEVYAYTVDGTEHLSLEFLRKYIAYAKRNHHPNLNADARAKILDYYTNERQSFGREDQMGDSEVIPITARALEALIRLTEAHARMHLRDTATGEDAKVALAVFRHWREESNIEDDSELYSGVSASARSNNTTIRNIVREICSSGDGSANITEIYNAASARKITETAVDDVLQRMLVTGELFSPRNNIYQFAR